MDASSIPPRKSTTEKPSTCNIWVTTDITTSSEDATLPHDPSFPRFYKRRADAVETPIDPNAIANFLQDAAEKIEYPPFPERSKIGTFTTFCMSVGFMVGSGIFLKPSTVVEMTGSKGLAILFWIIGGAVSFGGLFVYSELAISFPFNGADIIYAHELFRRPRHFVMTIVSTIYILNTSLAANCVSASKLLFLLFEPNLGEPDFRLLKLVAVLIITGICLLHAYARRVGIAISNIIVIFKVLILLSIIGFGFVAGVGGIGVEGVGAANLKGAFKTVSKMRGKEQERGFADFSAAALAVLWSYEGWVEPTWIRAEIKSPKSSPNRVFKRGSFAALGFIMFAYVLVNVSFMTVLTHHELTSPGEITLTKFFVKLFGDSVRVRRTLNALVLLCIIGNLVVYIYSAARIKQEIAKMRILPFSRLLAKQSLAGAPTGALMMQWLTDTMSIVCAPEKNYQGIYDIITNRYIYLRSYLVAIACLGVYSLRFWPLYSWQPEILGAHTLITVTTLVLLFNLTLIAFTWLPNPSTVTYTFQDFLMPAVATAFLAVGVIYWAVYAKVLPLLGVHIESRPDVLINGSRIITYARYKTGWALKVEKWWATRRREIKEWIKRAGRWQGDYDDDQ